MNKSLLASIASGYLTIAFQAVIGLLLIPFLLSGHGVGLGGYGIIATIQATVAALAVVLDGHRQQSSRRLAEWSASGNSGMLAGLLGFTFVVTLLFASVAAVFGASIAAWLELPSEYVDALRLALLTLALEQCCYLLDSGLHAARRSWIANAVGAADALFRAVLVVTLFTIHGASVEWFFVAALASLSGRAGLLLFICRDNIADTDRSVSRILRREAAQLARSMPLALNGIAPYLVFRLSVIVGNKFLGAQQAGVLAIILVTLRTYLNQAIFSAMRPLLIPRLGLRELGRVSSPTRARFADYLKLYQAIVYSVAIAVVCATPFWLPLWLGESLRPFIPHVMVAVAVYFLEIAYGIPYYALVAHDRARPLAMMNGLIAAAAAVVLVGVSRSQLPLVAYVLTVTCYLVLYTLFVRHYFRRLLGCETVAIDIALTLAVVAVAGGALLAARAGDTGEVLAVSAAATAIFLAVCHFAVTPLSGLAKLMPAAPVQRK